MFAGSVIHETQTTRTPHVAPACYLEEPSASACTARTSLRDGAPAVPDRDGQHEQLTQRTKPAARKSWFTLTSVLAVLAQIA